jgi:hypothetical protein
VKGRAVKAMSSESVFEPTLLMISTAMIGYLEGKTSVVVQTSSYIWK